MAEEAQNIFATIATDFDMPSNRRVEAMLGLLMHEGRAQEYGDFRESLSLQLEAWLAAPKTLPNALDIHFDKIGRLAVDPSAENFRKIEAVYEEMMAAHKQNERARYLMQRRHSDIADTFRTANIIEKELHGRDSDSIGFNKSARHARITMSDAWRKSSDSSFLDPDATQQQLYDTEDNIKGLKKQIENDYKRLTSAFSAIEGIRSEFEAAEEQKNHALAVNDALQKATIREYFNHLQTVGLKTVEAIAAPRTAKFTRSPVTQR